MLEFGRVDNPVLDNLYDAYSFRIIPEMGHLVAGDRRSYQYLVESIRRFPPQREFASMMLDAGFSNVSFTNYAFGVVAQYSGFNFPR